MKRTDKKYNAMYAIAYETTEGEILGQTEHSFSMGCSSNRIKVFSFIKGYKEPKHLKEGKFSSPVESFTDEKRKVTVTRSFIIRISSPKCGIKIDFSERIAMLRKQRPFDKYLWRNVPFTVNEICV